MSKNISTVHNRRKMKRIFLLVSISVVLFTSCTKDNGDIFIQEKDVLTNEANIIFSLNEADIQFKVSDLGPQCNDELKMDYAVFVLGDTEYTSNIQIVNGALQTQAVKITEGTYTLNSFLVFDNNRTPENTSDDILIKAAPQIGSDYYELMANPLDIDIFVHSSNPIEKSVDLLCYDPVYYNEFGFDWTENSGIRIEHQYISGGICVDNINIYKGSLYEKQEGDNLFEIPAIFEIHVYKQGVQQALRVFSNEDWQGEGQSLEVYWPNRLDLTEEFYFELWVLLPTITGFEYLLMNTWEFTDDQGASTGLDDTVDFKVGKCLSNDTDYLFDYSMLGTGDVQITLTWDSSSDLDLWVTDPSLEKIFYNHPSSLSGGILDIDDTNGFGPENIFWPENEAPQGEYLVQIHHFSGDAATAYEIQIVFFGNTYSYSGLIYENELIDITSLSTSKSYSAPNLEKRKKLDPMSSK